MAKMRAINTTIMNDENISDNQTFNTSICLTKGAFNKIRFIKDNVALSGANRSKILEAAVNHYYDYVTSPKYIEDLRKKADNL